MPLGRAYKLPPAAEAVPGAQAHIMALEGADQEGQQALLVGMEYLLSISFVDDDEARCLLALPSGFSCMGHWPTMRLTPGRLLLGLAMIRPLLLLAQRRSWS